MALFLVFLFGIFAAGAQRFDTLPGESKQQYLT